MLVHEKQTLPKGFSYYEFDSPEAQPFLVAVAGVKPFSPRTLDVSMLHGAEVARQGCVFDAGHCAFRAISMIHLSTPRTTCRAWVCKRVTYHEVIVVVIYGTISIEPVNDSDTGCGCGRV